MSAEGLMLTYLAVQRVQQRVTRAIRDSTASMSLPALAVVVALAAESSLIDLSLVRARKRHAIVFKLLP